jgi:tetratricopeptide (TPR) repeat protein
LREKNFHNGGKLSSNRDPGEKLGPTSSGRLQGFRTVWPCLTILLLSPLSTAAQSAATSTPSIAQRNSPTTDTIAANRVSAHELQIPRKAREAFNKGTELLDAKNSAASIPEFARAIQAFPDFYEAYYKIGLANLNLQQYPEAQTAFETSIALSKGRYAPSQFGLGVALCMQKQLAEAEEAVRAGLDQYPADATGHFTLAWILFGANKLSDAETSARRAILYHTDFAMAYLLLAQIHVARSDLSAATSDLDAYLRLDPEGAHSAEAKAVRVQAQRVAAQQKHGGEPALAKSPNR